MYEVWDYFGGPSRRQVRVWQVGRAHATQTQVLLCYTRAEDGLGVGMEVASMTALRRLHPLMRGKATLTDGVWGFPLCQHPCTCPARTSPPKHTPSPRHYVEISPTALLFTDVKL